MARLKNHPYRPKLISSEEQIRLLRRYADLPKKSDDLSKPITVPIGILLSLDDAADALVEQLSEETTFDQDAPRYGMYL